VPKVTVSSALITRWSAILYANHRSFYERKWVVIDIVRTFFIPLVCLGLLLSGLVHLLFPDETEKLMSRSRNVRIAGAVLLVLILPAIAWSFYILAVLFAIFGLPRLFAPDRSIHLQRLYPRRVHGVLLMMGATGLWIASRVVGK
jgi:hypothetical protein